MASNTKIDEFDIARPVSAAEVAAPAGAGVMATKDRHEELEQRVGARGIDLPSARARRQYRAVGAEQALARVVVGGIPDKAGFADFLRRAVEPELSAGSAAMTFAEMDRSRPRKSNGTHPWKNFHPN